jgi:hypothetical protein
MTGLFDQIKLLFEQQLYTNVVTLVSINTVMSSTDNPGVACGLNFTTLQLMTLLFNTTNHLQREIIRDCLHVIAS